jgi:hypothetical protein
MESVGDAKPWTIDRERRAYGLRVVLPKRTARGPRVLTVEVRRIEGSGPS